MNTYNLLLNGNVWLLILFIVVSGFVAVWTYSRTIPPIPQSRRWLFVSLRTMALALLFFILFEPVYEIIRNFLEKPKLAVLIDDSESMSAKETSGDRRAKLVEFIRNSGIADYEDKLVFLFDKNSKLVENFSEDSIKTLGKVTDISKALRRVGKYINDENVSATLLISDGVFNAGNNPIFDAERLGMPIFTVGLGDTSEPKDLVLASIVTNEIAYVDNPVPIQINIRFGNFPANSETKLTISDNGKTIYSENIIISNENGNDFRTVEYSFNPKEEGIRKITAVLSSIDGELSARNNSLSEYIKVLKNKRNVALFAGAPSPDVSFIKQNLQLDKGIEIKDYIQKQGAEFYTQPTQNEISSSEMIIFAGFPIQSTPKSVLDMILKELQRGKPLLFLAGQYVDYNKLKDFQDYLPFVVVSSRVNEFMVIPDVKPAGMASPLLRVTGSDDDLKLWNKLPPIFRTETFVRVKPESDVVATMKVNNAPLNDPLIVTRSFQNSKSIAILGYGLYRWKLLGYASELSKGRTETTDLFTTLLNNSFRWLSLAESKKLVSIKTNKKFYNSNEAVEFIAEVYDGNYTPIDKATVAVKSTSGKNTRDIKLTSLGNGRYYGSIPSLESGDYSFSGSAKLNDKNLGEDNGRFTVGDISLEFRNLKANYSLLRAISSSSGGKFYSSEEFRNVVSDISKHKAFRSRSVKERSETALWNYPYLLGLAILLFGIEWFLRKRSGMI